MGLREGGRRTGQRLEGLEVARWNRLHPESEPRLSYVEQCLKDRPGPVVAATDYIKTYPDQIRPFVRNRYVVLGTDGFGRSDTREKLRRFFEVDRHHVAVAALKALADTTESVSPKQVGDAIRKYGIDPEAPYPPKV